MPSPFPADKKLKKPVTVFCGSSPGASPIFEQAARAVGKALAEADIPLVYGGGRRGIMGVVSRSTLEAGGYVHGIIPKALMERASENTSGGSKEGSGEELLTSGFDGRLTTEVTINMHERKMRMAQYSTGGFVVLPGGYGTFEEVLEMITWNQLGIHSKPVIILNVGNFFAPLRTLFEGAVTAGFIQPQNLSLCKIVDLEGGKPSNFDEAKSEQWGDAAIRALEQWSIPATAGYGLKWEDEAEGETATEETASSSSSSQSRPAALKRESAQPLSLFTTMRYISTAESVKRGIEKDDIPLLSLHFERLREAHGHFSHGIGGPGWGDWPGEDAIWNKIKDRLEAVDQERPQGDWRVRVVIHPKPSPDGVEVQAVPAPADAGPFQLRPLRTKGKGRALTLDPLDTDVEHEESGDLDMRLYKTTNREIYDTAQSRAPKSAEGSAPEVLLHTSTHLLETTTSNIAIFTETGWITPRLHPRSSPFLHGVLRRYLLSEGIIREGDLTVADWHAAKAHGQRVIGFNGLRGVWEAELI